MSNTPYHPGGDEIAACDHNYEVKRTKPYPEPGSETAVEVCRKCGAKHVYVRPTRQRPLSEFQG